MTLKGIFTKYVKFHLECSVVSCVSTNTHMGKSSLYSHISLLLWIRLFFFLIWITTYLHYTLHIQRIMVHQILIK